MTRPLLSAVLALALLLSPASAGAANVSGEQLLALCTANMGGGGNELEAAECMGFVVGVADSFDCVEAAHGYRWNSSAGVSQPIMVQVVVQHMADHPADLATGGHAVVAQALSEAFPCPAQSAGN